MNEQKTHLSVYQVLTALLLASILNLNIFRIVLRTSSNMISYPIFALFFILILIQNGKRTHFELNIPVAAAIFLYIAWSIVSLFMFGGSYLREFIKFLIAEPGRVKGISSQHSGRQQALRHRRIDLLLRRGIIQEIIVQPGA